MTYWRVRSTHSARPWPTGCGPAAGGAAAGTATTPSPGTSSGCRSPDGPPRTCGQGFTGSAAGLPEFHRLLRITEQRDGFRLGRSPDYCERQYAVLNAEQPGRMKLCLAVHEGGILAAHTMISTGRRVWYRTGASADHRREVRPSNALPWRILLDAQAQGAEVYGMRGVSSTLDPDDRPFGLLRWKFGTGGQVVETLGEWETSVGGTANKALYRAFQAYLAHR